MMNVTGIYISPISEAVDGDTRDRKITGYAIVDGDGITQGTFDTLELAGAAWDLIISGETPVTIIPQVIAEGEARPAP